MEEQLLLFLPSMPLSRGSASLVPVSPFALLTWERRIGDSDSFSSAGAAKDSRSCATWPTATATDSRSSGAAGYSTESGRHAGTTLTDATRAWQTPRASDGEKGGPNQTLKGKPALSMEAAQWATPAAGLHNYAENPESFEARSARLVEQGTRPLGVNLGQQAQGWRSPTARDGSGTGGADPVVRLEQGHSVGLKDQVTTWPTPAARDHKGANSPEHLAKERGHHDQLPNAVAMRFPPAPATSPDGQPTSQPEARPRLNPAFVEALMGWPAGWSLPMPRGQTGCDCSATESCPSRPPPPSPSSLVTSLAVNHDDE